MAESSILCRQCGTANPPGNNFCGQCGTYLAPRPAAAASRPREASPEEARNRRNIAIIYAITAIFVVSCIVLSLVVIIWRP
jgi:uncharacterized membrane protein YvbJ